MNLGYGYYLIDNNFNKCPAWVRSEGYFNCENFTKFFKLFK